VEHPERSWKQRTANDLHDGAMQTVVSVSLELDGLAHTMGSSNPLPPDEVVMVLHRLRSSTQQAAAELRAIVRGLTETAEGDADPFRFAPELVRAVEGLTTEGWRAERQGA
jgi:signal transduction histidine kinase